MKTKNMILYALSNLGDMLLSHASSQSTSALADVHKHIAGGGAGYREAKHSQPLHAEHHTPLYM